MSGCYGGLCSSSGRFDAEQAYIEAGIAELEQLQESRSL